MKKKQISLIVISLFFIASQGIFAQHPGGGNRPDFNATNGIIKGKVVDSQTKSPVEYANISLYSYRDSSLKAGTITNSDGIFTLDNLHYGRYYLKVNFIGYKSKLIPNIKVTPKSPTVFLGTIIYEPSINKLDEVTVSDNKSLVEYKLDKKIVNVEQDLSSIGGNAIDVLKNVPSVQVDMDDNVTLRGSSNITILIDGKRSAFASSSDVLQQIPTSAIASIELITNPSAKYDPDGLAGIINIILKKNKKKGVNLTVSANGGTSNRYGGSVDFNVRVSKWNFFTSYNLRNNMREFSGNTAQTNYFENDSVSYLEQKAHKQRNRFSQSFRGGIDFYPNDNNTISLSSSFRIGSHASSGITNYLDKTMDNVSWSYFDTYNNDTADDNSMDVSLDYEKKFTNPEQKLTASANFSERHGDESGFIDNYFSIYEMMASDSVFHQQNFTKNNDQISSFQMDYVQPFNEFTKIEAGIKGDMENEDDDYVFQDFNSDINLWQDDTNTTNHFVYQEQRYAGYTTFSSKVLGFQYLLGIRLEQVFRNSEQKTAGENFKDGYFNYFPSLHISKKIDKKNQLQLSYSRRINRPRSRMLNPFKNYSNPLFIRQGNPALMPELIDSYELNYQRRINKIFLTASLFYKQINNAMTHSQRLDNGQMLMTFANIESKKNYGVELSANAKITNWWQLNGNLSYFKNIVDATDLSDVSSTAESMNWTGRMMNNFSLPKNFSMQITGFYMSPSVTAQGSRESFYLLSVGAKKDFLNRKWSLSANFSDVLNTMKFHFYAEGDGFSSESEFHRLSRIFYVSLTYRFNTLKNNKQSGKGNRGGNGGIDPDSMMDDAF